MSAERDRVARLRRIERVRAISKQIAANEAAEAEGTLGQLMALRDRTRDITASYNPKSSCDDAGDLQRMGHFIGGVSLITQQAETDITVAQTTADAKQALLRTAERRRSLVSERIVEADKGARKEKSLPTEGRRKNWHAS